MGIFQPVPDVGYRAIIGKTYLGNILDNDRLFQGRLDGRITYPYAELGRWIAQETSLVIWEGWHYFDHTRESMLYYRFGCKSDDSGHPSSLRMFYDGAQVALVTGNQSGIVWTSGSYSLSGKGTGLYRVYFELIRNQEDNWYGATGYAVPPYSGWDGIGSYSDGTGNFVDGAVSDPLDFAPFEVNDLYFWEKQAPIPAGQGIHGLVAGGSSKPTRLWQMYVSHETEIRTVDYKIGMQTDNPNYGDASIQIVWDADGAGTVIKNIPPTTPGSWEWFTGTATIPSSAVAGNWYSLSVRIWRGNPTEGDALGSVESMYIRRTEPMPFYDPGDFTVGHYLFGNGGLRNLALNDERIVNRLVYRNWAVMENHSRESLGGPGEGEYEYYFTRRGDFLIYRGRGGKLEFAASKKEAALQDAGTEDNPEVYRVVDLNSIVGLHYGMDYAISGNAQFACEV